MPARRLPHEPTVDLERQTQFRQIAWPRQRSAGALLDPVQAVAHRIGVAEQQFACGAQ